MDDSITLVASVGRLWNMAVKGTEYKKCYLKGTIIGRIWVMYDNMYRCKESVEHSSPLFQTDPPTAI